MAQGIHFAIGGAIFGQLEESDVEMIHRFGLPGIEPYRSTSAEWVDRPRELKKLLDTAKKAWPEARKETEKGLPPDGAKPTLALLDEAVNNPKLAKTGKAVTLTVARPKDWPAPPRE